MPDKHAYHVTVGIPVAKECALCDSNSPLNLFQNHRISFFVPVKNLDGVC